MNGKSFMGGRRYLYRAILVLFFLVNQTMGAETMRGELISAEDLTHLPEPVQRFLKYSEVIGTPWISEASIKQTGLFKIAPDKEWVPFTATQVYNINEASFVWKVRMKMAPLMRVTGTDRLQNGQGSMKIKLFGLIPLVNAKGPEMNQGAMTRYLSEVIWFPQAFLDQHISWEAIDSSSAKAIFTIGETSVEGIFHFNDFGQMTYFECERYASEGKKMVLRPWRTPVDEYDRRAGLMLGTRGRAIWDFPEGEYAYIDVEITEVTYK